MVKLDCIDGDFVVTAALSERDLVLSINGVKALDTNRWAVAGWPMLVDTVLMVQGTGGEITGSARVGLRLLGEFWKEIQLIKDKPYAAEMLGFVELYPAQVADARFLAAMRSGMVFNHMRTGKTFSVLSTVERLDSFPVLVACKPTNVGEWQRQIAQAFPDKTVLAITSGMVSTKRAKLLAEANSTDFVLIGHNLLEKHGRVLTYPGLSQEQRVKERDKEKHLPKELNAWNFAVVIGDEAHRLANPNALITRALWALGDKAQHRFALTGTPAPNHEDELWGLLRFCFPEWFPFRSKWLKRFVNMQENQFGILECRGWNKETAAQWDSVYGGLHTRRLRTTGPSVEHRYVPVELSATQRRVTKQLAKECLADYDGDILSATDSMSLMHALSQIACGTPEVEEGKVVGLKSPSSKIDTLLEILEESDEKAIVVAEHKSVMRLAGEALRKAEIPFTLFVGGMTHEAREKSVNDFNYGTPKVMLMSQAGAEGIDLPAAKRTVYMERSWDLTINLQSESRNTGPAQTSSVVEVIDLVALETLEEDKYQALISKETRLHNLLRDVNWIRRTLGVK